MVKRVFPGASTPPSVKRKLYLSLVVPTVTYGSPVWRPSLIRDIVSLENLQRRATKYILHDYHLDYKSRLRQLKLLPLMYQLEFIEVVFFITQLNCRSSSFDILNYFSFSFSTTCCASHSKLIHSSRTLSAAHNTFFHRFPRLWNSLPPINLSSSITSLKRYIKSVFINRFNMFLILMIHTHYMLSVLVLSVHVFLFPLLF